VAPRDLLAVDAEQVQHWGLRIAVSVFFLLVCGAFIRLVIWVLDKLAERNAKRRLFFKRLVPIARISLWFLAILFAAMVILHIEAQGLIAAGAAVGVAVGFAAQDILKNIFGGLIVLFDQPFQVGDKISVEGTYGEVVSIGLRSTRIVTPDDNLVSVPNAQVVDGQVANANAGELNCQVVTELFLPGWVDEAKAKRIAFEAAASSRYVFLNKPIVVLVKDEFRETFLTHLKVKAYVLDPRYEFLFQSDVTERARAGFRQAGLLGPMHGVRAYIDLDSVSGDDRTLHREEEGEEENE
jgi:small-conductance mechanosensitive channel